MRKMVFLFCVLLLLLAGICRIYLNSSRSSFDFGFSIMYAFPTGLPNVESDLSCFTQSALPSGNLPEKITTEDWAATAELAVCKPSIKWSGVWIYDRLLLFQELIRLCRCVQYFIKDKGTEYVSGGCLGDFLGRCLLNFPALVPRLCVCTLAINCTIGSDPDANVAK